MSRSFGYGTGRFYGYGPEGGEFDDDQNTIPGYAPFPVAEHCSPADDDVCDAACGLSSEERKMRRYFDNQLQQMEKNPRGKK